MTLTMRTMYYLFLFLCCFSTVFSLDVHSLPLHRIEAEKVKTEEKKIILEGSVVAVLDLGTMTCGKAIVTMNETSSKRDKKEDITRVLDMEQHVEVHFSDGGFLSADHGIVDCVKREGVFWGSDTEKVVYETALIEKGKKSRMRASSHCLRGKLVKTEVGWTLDDLNAEGSVCIEYRPEEEMNHEK